MRRFDRAQLWTLVPALVLLLLTAGLSLDNWLEFQRNRAAEQTSRAIVKHTNRLLTLVKDAETGQRGYLLTGNNIYLDPYERAVPEIRGELAELAELAAGETHDTVRRLNDAVGNKLDELTQTIQLRQNGDAGRALAVVESGRGQEDMNRIRVLVAQLVTGELEQAGRRGEFAQSHANRLGTVGTTGSILTCLLLFGAMLRLSALRRRELETRNVLAATLGSIGDAVITTDVHGAVTFLNVVAEQLTGWASVEAFGQKLEKVFRIVNQQTRQSVESPAVKVLREGRVVGLANHTMLIGRDGVERPIDDSGAPIRDAQAQVSGVVLVFRDVTERYHAQSALEASEQRYRMLFENNPQPMWIFDEETFAFLDVNQAAVSYYGYTREEFLRMTLRDIRPPEEVPGLLADLGKHRTTRHSDGPWLHRKKDGTVMVVEITAVPIEVSGHAAKFVSATDVTARVQAEAALRRSEEQYRAIVETASDAIITIDEHSKILFASEPVEKIFGYEPKELNGMPLTGLMPEPLRAAHLAGFRRYLETNQRHTSWQLLELPGLRKDGTEVPLELSFGEFRSGVERWFTGVIRDVSERRNAQEKLRETRELMQTVFNTVPLAIWGIDLLGRVIFWNRAAEAMFQWTEAEVRDRELPIIPDEQHEEFHELLGEYATGRQLAGYERKRIRKDGSAIRCSIWTASLHSAAGSITGTVGVLADITERKRAEKETRDHLHYLARCQRDLEQFAWAASHDLLDPLRIAAEKADLLERLFASHLPEDGKQLVKELRSAAAWVKTLVNALREYWEVQHCALTRESVPLNSVLDRAVQILNAKLAASGGRVNRHDMPSVIGDPQLLVQLFTQLLDNAIKFRSSAAPQIDVSAEATAAGWTVRVEDNGIGMEPESGDRVFHLFHKPAPERSDAGIGLSLCKQIMERHGGSISIASQPGFGTTVYLEFTNGADTNLEPASIFTAAASAGSVSEI